MKWDIDGTTSTLKYTDLCKVAQDTPLQFVGNSDGQQSSSQVAKTHCIAVYADNDAYHFVREICETKKDDAPRIKNEGKKKIKKRNVEQITASLMDVCNDVGVDTVLFVDEPPHSYPSPADPVNPSPTPSIRARRRLTTDPLRLTLSSGDYVDDTPSQPSSSPLLHAETVLDSLESGNITNWLHADIYLAPSNDANCSDEDSGNEEHVDINSLSKNLLLSTCELPLQTEDQSAHVIVVNNQEALSGVENTVTVATEASIDTTNDWVEVSDLQDNPLSTKVEGFMPPTNPFFADPETHNKCGTPATLFEFFFDDELVKFICEMTNQYAVECNTPQWDDLKPTELKTFLGIIMLTGYARLPSWKMYWEEALDVSHHLVKNSMPRNRFAKILSPIHFCDNSSIDPADKCGKVRPILTMLQA